MQSGLGFHFEQAGHFDRSGLADARHIIAKQIDDHQVFSAVFWVVRKKIPAGAIFDRIVVPRLGAFHRTGLYVALRVGTKK